MPRKRPPTKKERNRLRRHERAISQPDDYFSAGPLEFARFGNIVMGRSHASAEQLGELHKEMAEHLTETRAEIDALVSRIADRVSCLPPEMLLLRAWWEHASLIAGLSGKEADEGERIMAMRMVDYVQSVIASVPPQASCAENVAEEEWAQLRADVLELFTKLSFEYQVVLTASKKVEDPNLDMELEDFRHRTETHWMNVRGERYQPHERQALLDVLSPHSDILVRLFGIDAATLVTELDKILAKLTRGLHDAVVDMDQFHVDTIARMAELAEETGIHDLAALRDRLFEDDEFVARRDRIGGELFGLDLFDVEVATHLPKSLVEELAWSPGEENEFFAPGEYRGWPLRIWPTMKRPFIRLNGRVLCFDMFALFDGFYRVLQRLIHRLAPDYDETWNTRQKAVSEALPLVYLERILPDAGVVQPAYYRWSVGNGQPQWYEADALVIYDDHLFVIEVKAGAFTYTSPATDLPSHIASLQNLVMSPASQGNRFIDFLESAPEVTIADADHRPIRSLRRSDFRHVTACAVTLDPFTELAARAQHLRSIGINVGARPVWVLSIDDLRVYADLFDNPLKFLHFTEQRMNAELSSLVEVADEMDHFGLYIERNNYRQYAEELAGPEPAKLMFDGYRKLVDSYYAEVARGEVPDPPNQRVPGRIDEIIDWLAPSGQAGRSEIASWLLDAAGDVRQAISDSVDQQLRSNARLGRARPASMSGERALTLWVWSPRLARDPTLVLDHTRTVMAVLGESSRLALEIEYSKVGKVVDVRCQQVDLDGLSETELAQVQVAGLAMRRKRLAEARAERKIGANEPCPCGSGRKYKCCCRALNL